MGRRSVFLPDFIAIFMFACHGGRRKGPGTGDMYSPQAEVYSPYKVKVADVFNDTSRGL